MTEHKCSCKGGLDYYTVNARESGSFISFSKTAVFAITVTKEEDEDDFWVLTIHLAPGDTELDVTSGTWAQVMNAYHRICEKLGIRTTDLTEY